MEVSPTVDRIRTGSLVLLVLHPFDPQERCMLTSQLLPDRYEVVNTRLEFLVRQSE